MEILSWFIVGLLAVTVFFLSAAVNALMDIKERQGEANVVLGGIKLEVENINQKMESLIRIYQAQLVVRSAHLMCWRRMMAIQSAPIF